MVFRVFFFFLSTVPSVQSHLYLIMRFLARIDWKKYEAGRLGGWGGLGGTSNLRDDLVFAGLHPGSDVYP